MTNPVIRLTLVTDEQANLVMRGVVYLLKQKEGNNVEKKMVSSFAVTELFRKQNVPVDHLFIQMALDYMVQQGMIRYYTNDQGYRYFGVTKEQWAKIQAEATQTA